MTDVLESAITDWLPESDDSSLLAAPPKPIPADKVVVLFLHQTQD
jgi:hypothetical protein